MRNKIQKLLLVFVITFVGNFLFKATAVAGRLQLQKPQCAVSDLSFAVNYKKGYFNGMSHSGALLIFYNKGSKACLIPARPLVNFESAKHVQLPISWEPPKGMHPGPVLLPIVLPKGGCVTSQIRWISSKVFNKSKCISPAFVTLSVGNHALRRPFKGRLCGPANKNPTYTLTLFKHDPIYSKKFSLQRR